MATANWTKEQTQKAKEIWEEHQRTNNLEDRRGQAVGIDPVTGEIWFGDSVADIVRERESEGLSSPLFFERVGSTTYLRKGHHS